MRMVGMLCGAVFLLVACGGGTASDPPSTTTTTVATGSDIVPVKASPCSLVTVDEVTTAAGLTVAESRDELPISCVFDFGDDVGVSIFINVEDGDGRLAAPAAVLGNYKTMVAEGTAETIPNLGVTAVYAPGFRGLAVDAGSGRYIALGVNGGYGELAEPRDVLIELAEAALGRL